MPRTVLVADDSPTIRKIVELCLKGQGITVLQAADGSEALARLRTEKPGLVLADTVMPGADGYEICRKIKGETGSSVPVILLADLFVPYDEGRARSAGADGSLSKPFEAAALVALVGSHMRSAGTPGDAGSETLVLEKVPELEELPVMDAAEPEPAPKGKGRASGSSKRASRAPATGDAADRGAESGPLRMSQAEIDAVARRVVEMLSEDVVREVAWEVVPEMSELLIREKMQAR